MDLILEARAFHNGSLSDVEIGIDESSGTITAVKRNLTGATRRRHRGLLLLPSGVDWHVHFRDPGFSKKEDFRTGTTGAALGGVGTVLDMPNTKPVVDRPSVLLEKQEAVARKAVVDWGLWATLTPRSLEPERLIEKAVGVKLYLGPTTNAEEPLSDAFLADALRFVHAQRKWAVLHAESTPKERSLRDTRDHDDSRDAASEVAAIRRAAALAPKGARVHVAHATTREAVAVASEAGFTSGATPHHLLLSHESHRDAFGKVNPPLRSEIQRSGLWDALKAGLVRHLESDHAPHTLDEKRQEFASAPSGVPGVETLLPLLLYKAKHGDVELKEVVQAASERPAEDLGIRKGRIAPGYDADFFLIDPREPVKLRGDELASKCGWTPFEGHPAFRPAIHYLRGEVVVEEGEFIGRAGRGRRVQPQAP